MNDLTSSLDKDRKRPFVSSDALNSLKSLLHDNLALNESLIDREDEIETKKRRESQLLIKQQVLIKNLTEPNVNETKPRRVITLKEYSERRQIQLSEIPSTTPKRIVLRDNEEKVEDSHETDSIKSPESSSIIAAAAAAPTTMHITEQWLMQIRGILASSQTQDNKLRAIGALTSFTNIDHDLRLNFSPNNNQVTTTRQYPIFQSMRTPTEEHQSYIPPQLLDCCESHQQQQQSASIERKSEYFDSCPTSLSLRETMINIANRLVKTEPIPMVDTHCHFDLIFDRLYIQHNDPKKYFDEYKDFYPPGLSFELAIHVFWRPRHLTLNNWLNRYSKYLDDERVYGSCGIHPHWSFTWKESYIRDIERCLQHPRVIAIGEIGLDFGPKNTCNMDQQSRVFEEQLKLAAKWCKPVVIHSRNAYQQTFNIMKEHLSPNHKIHLHCFVGTIADAQLFTSYFTEIKFGFTPIVTRVKFLHIVIAQLDLRQILSETDSPYFVPEELSNLSRCAHPGMVYSVIELIAQIRQLPIEKIARQLRENAQRIYGV
ncbi:unnamed protein product [Adineta ricciae]|uniref:Uncharacterized protein n=1 Tax=Adineta ricciae TaxID=249248 RepID=A0A814YJU8_ADIRI|nr:unnamed protein product [Adineta ricciae]